MPQWVNFDPMGHDFLVKMDHFLSKMVVVTKSPFPRPLKVFFDYIPNGSFFSVFQKFTQEPKGPFVTILLNCGNMDTRDHEIIFTQSLDTVHPLG